MNAQTPKILIIDDDVQIVEILALLLRSTFTVHATSNSLEAIKIYKEINPSVILCDLMMPGLSGMDFYHAIQEHHQGDERKIIFISGGFSSEKVYAFLAAIPNHRIHKPFQTKTIRSLIEAVLAAKTTFALTPFVPPPCALEIEGSLALTGTEGRVEFRVSGELDRILLPSLSSSPGFKDRLWEKTCFELFWAPVGKSAYTEFNFSPSGDYAVYNFADYRSGMTACMPERQPNITFTQDGDNIILTASFQIPVDAPVELGFATVIQSTEKQNYYYALAHAELQPDFHRRDAFLVRI